MRELAHVLQGFLAKGSGKSNFVNEKILPEFDPERGDMSATEWVQRVNNCGDMYEWDDKTKFYLAVLKLMGNASLWYNGLQGTLSTWKDLSDSLITQFPSRENFGRLMREAVNYESAPGQNLQTYCFVKLAKINRLKCEFSEERKVDLIANGIHDEKIRTIALASSYQTVSELSDCLSIFSNKEGKKEVGNIVSKNQPPREEKRKVAFKGACFGCGQVGHKEGFCPEKNILSKEAREEAKSLNQSKNANGVSGQKDKGGGCNFCGLSNHTEDKCFKKNNAKNNKSNQPLSVLEIKNLKVSKPVKMCVVNDSERECTIDLGSDCSLVSETEARSLGLKLKTTDKILSGFNNALVAATARSKIKIVIDGIEFRLKVLIVPDDQLSRKILIGRDVLTPGVIVIADSESFRFIKSDNKLLDADDDLLRVNNVDTLKPIEERDVKRENLSEPDVRRLIELLNTFRNAIAMDISELKESKIGEMRIELISDAPVCHRPLRMSRDQRERLNALVAKLQEAGIVRESASSYASPAFLITKKSGEDRLVINYKALNAITKRIKFPLPLIDDLIDKLGGKNYYFSLDLKSGFYQIPMHPDSIDKTAFITPDNLLEFTRISMGLSNGPTEFQKIMQKVLKGTSGVSYLDDVFLVVDTIEEGFEELKKILQAFANYNLSLNLRKCRFFMTKIDFLGRELSKEGVRPGSSHLRAISEAQAPRTVKGVRQFLGLANFSRKFVKNYAEKVSPLTNLLRKNVAWEWGPEQMNAMQTVKEILLGKPLLATFESGLKTELHTDASSIGLGGMLIQLDGKEKRVVGYYSRKTTPVEQKYHSYDLETLAVYASLKYFRVYLLGIKFSIVTDCIAIRATATKKDILPRVARWWAYFQDYDYTIEYRPGKQVAHVDYLSRNPVDCFSIDITESEWIKAAQMQDDDIEVIRKILESGNREPEVKHYFENYDLRKGVVFRKTESGNKWVVPRVSRWNIVKMCHDDQGHFAVEKTLEIVRENYWFKGMRRFVKKYVSACLNCLYYKSKTGKKPGFLNSIEKVAIPFHTLHLDHVGPFIRTRGGNTEILTIIDGFTKFCVIEPVKNTKAKHVIKSLVQLFVIFGVPTRIISDQGAAFTSSSFKSFCLSYGIKHVLNAVATPRANGQCERSNRTILSALAATCGGTEGDTWDTEVKKVQSAINCAPHRTTKVSPSQLLLGYKPRAAADAALTGDIQRTIDQLDLNELRHEAKNRIDKDQQEQKKIFDARRFKPPSYQVGDVVMVTSNAPATGESRKLAAKAKGPFKVTAKLPNDRYEVQDLRDLKKAPNHRSVVAVDSMQKWVTFDAME